MKYHPALILMLLLPAAGFAQPGQLQKLTPVTGTRVSLTPPANFVASTQFPGFTQEALGASVMVTEFPGARLDAAAVFANPAELQKRGMTLLGKEEVSVNGRAGLLLHVKQQAYGTEFLKWLLVLAGDNESVMVTATFPQEHEGQLSGPLKASVLSARWDAGRARPADEGLTFTLAGKGNLKRAERLGNAIVYTKDGIFPSKDLHDPLFIVAPSVSKLSIPDAEAFSRARVTTIHETITDVKVETITPAAIDGLGGYEIVAQGKDRASGEPMLVYQVTLFEGGSDQARAYYLMAGLVSARRGGDYLPFFKEMTRSFKRKQP